MRGPPIGKLGIGGLALAAALVPAIALARPGPAAPDPLALGRAGLWAEAAARAAELPDPVAAKLVRLARLLVPGRAGWAEIGAFMAANPDWPLRAVLARRRDEALAAEPDPAAALAPCLAASPRLSTALARCAEAERTAGHVAEAAAAMRAAWLALPADPAIEAAFATAHPGTPDPETARSRFERMLPTSPDAAARMLPWLDPARRPLAEARLALRRGEPLAPDPVVPPDDPGLRFELARRLRLDGRPTEAAALWRAGIAPSPDLDPTAAAIAGERDRLARDLMAADRAEDAYAVAAADPADPGLLFLSGWIALRRLHDPARASARFGALAEAPAGRSAITQARARYWLARAAPDPDAARMQDRLAAAWPTTYYGQLSSAALGEPASALARRLRDAGPNSSPERAVRFAGDERVRAALLLAAWNQPGWAAAFLTRAADGADPAGRALAARLATSLGLPQAAVAIARAAGREGIMLPDAGWPAPFAVPPGIVDPALALGVMRQESGFDPRARSPSGALGLMQLMPRTAAELARQLGQPFGPAGLFDPTANARLGGFYLQRMLVRFGAPAVAVAAYNAGPNRVAEWLARPGQPRPAAADPNDPGVADWIESIPFDETRNYVQRVLENAMVYRLSRQGDGFAAQAGPVAR